MQYKFKKPVKFGEETIESVELREEFDDMIRIANAKGDGDKTGAMLAAATGWPLPKVSKISMADGVALAEIVGNFINLGQKDGKET